MLVHVLAMCSALVTPPQGRRAILTHAAAAAVTLPAFAANAKGADGNESGFIKDIIKEAGGYKLNEEGDAKIYTPKIRVDGAGSKSSLLLMKMPDPGPLSAGDYVDVMFFRDDFGAVLAACQYRDTGKSFTEPVEGIKGKSIEPKFLARVDAGAGAVYPVVHTAKGYVWQGKPVTVK